MYATGKKLYYFNEAFNCTVDKYQCHGAVLVKGNKIISRGKNRIDGRVLKNNVCSIHAEIDCLHNLINNDKYRSLSIVFHIKNNIKKCVKNIDIYIVKRNSNGIGYSRPCKHCLEILKKCNIRRIYYSIHGLIKNNKIYYNVERCRDMKTNHLSYSAKQFYSII